MYYPGNYEIKLSESGQIRVKLLLTVSDSILFMVVDMADIRLVIDIFNQ